MKVIWACESSFLIPFGPILNLANSRGEKNEGFSPDFSKFLKTKNIDAAFYSKYLEVGFS